MPHRSVVHDWETARPEVGKAIARARDAGFDAIAFEALRIADDTTEDPQSRRVRVDTRLKLLSKWCPKRYGERVEIEASSELNVIVKIGGGDVPV